MKFKNIFIFGLVFMFLISLVSATTYQYEREDDNNTAVWIIGNWSATTKQIYFFNASTNGTYAQKGKIVFPFLFDDFNDASVNTTLWNTSGVVTERGGGIVGKFSTKGNLTVNISTNQLMFWAKNKSTSVYYPGFMNKFTPSYWALYIIQSATGFRGNTYPPDTYTATILAQNSKFNKFTIRNNLAVLKSFFSVNSGAESNINSIWINNLVKIGSDYTTTNTSWIALRKYNISGASPVVVCDAVLKYCNITSATTLTNYQVLLRINSSGNLKIIDSAGASNLITAKSSYDNSAINSFTITITNSTGSYNEYTSIGTILRVSNNKYQTIKFWNWSGFNKTYINYNFSYSGNLQANLSSTDITFNIRFHDTNRLINFTTINITDINRTKVMQTTTGILRFYPLPTNIKFKFKDDNLIFITKNQSFTFTTRQNQTFNITVNDTENRIRFLDKINSSAISNATITIIYPDSSVSIKTTNSTGWINVPTNYNGDFQFGTYQLTFYKSGYTSITIPISILHTNSPRTITYNISRAYINVNIYYRNNGSLLKQAVQLNFLTLFNASTSIGQYNKSDVSLIAGNYTVQALSSGFGTETKTFSYTAQSNITIDFYLLLLNQSNAGTLFINNYKNIVGFVLSGAKDILMEYDPVLLSYKQVSECYSNTNGECGFNIELGTKTYYIRATKTINDNLYTAQTLQSGEIILTDNEIRNLVLTFSDEFTVLPEDDLVYSITESFVSNTSSITVDFYSLSGLPIEMCVQYFSISYGISTSEYKNCLNSTSALQTIPAIRLLNRSKSYRAEVYIRGTLGNTNLETFNYPSSNSSLTDTFDVWIINGLVLFIFICLLALALYMKNITLFSIATIIFSWLQVLILPTYSLVSVTTFITIISILLIITQKKPNEE